MISRSISAFAAILAICFLFQAASVGHVHAAHESQGLLVKHAGPAHTNDSLPEACHCDLCFLWPALDTASVIYPRVLGLVETAFTVVASYPSFSYPSPALGLPARGPPTLS